MMFALERDAFPGMRCGSSLGPRVWQGLFVGAVCHAEWVKHPLTHDFWKRLTQDIHQNLLSHRRPTAGVTNLQAGQNVDLDFIGVGGRFTVQNLKGGWDSL